MRIIRNKYLPFQGFSAINLFGILFVRGKIEMSDEFLNHERIHSRQQHEMLYLPFLLCYFVEWLILLFKFKGSKYAYRNISFEKEAYLHEQDLEYLNKRKFWAFVKFLK